MCGFRTNKHTGSGWKFMKKDVPPRKKKKENKKKKTGFCWAYMQSADLGALIRGWVNAGPGHHMCLEEDRGGTDSDLPPQ